MQYLILGANGYIGSYIYERMQESGLSAIGTGHKRVGHEELIYYDIQKDNIEDILQDRMKDNEKTAIVCITESNIDKCHVDYEECYRTNVVAIKSLIHKLHEKRFHVIFFSSDNVFSGEKGDYTEESPTCAVNDYGKMKEEIETYLLENEPQTCIFRISKVVSHKKERQNIFTEWETQIKNGKIRCIQGNIISFVYIEDIYKACLLAAEKRLAGLYNVVGDQGYSRKELAQKFYAAKNVTNMKIHECGVGEFSFKDKRRPLNVRMSNQKFKEKTGYQFTSMDEVIKKYIKNNQEG